MSSIAERIDAVLARIDNAVARRGSGPDVELVAVSKRHPAPDIAAAHGAGLRHFGENYAQEFAGKADALASIDLQWHFIGALQSNKAKLVVGRALIHTVDRERLVDVIDKRAAGMGIEQAVLLEINFDASKAAGATPEQAPALLDAIASHAHVRCEGLMTIPPAGPPEDARQHFAALAELRESLRRRHPAMLLPHLSMGMSADFEVAIEEGATLVRVGTAIFGPRPS